MAIQLARAIGLQGGIPQSNLPQIIQDVGKTVASTIDKASQSMQAKAEKEKLLKDAVVASMKIDPPKAHPKDIKAWEDISADETKDLISKSIDGKMTPMQIQAEAEKKRIKLESIKLQAERDYAGYLAGGKQETQEQFHTDVYNKVLEGYPDTEVEEIDPKDQEAIATRKKNIESQRVEGINQIKNNTEYTAPQREAMIASHNSLIDSKLAKADEEAQALKQKKIIKGQKSYFDIPLESRFESGLDLGVILEGTKVKKSVGALKALESYMPNFKPESFVNVFKDSQGVITATPNKEEISATRNSYIVGMLSPADYGKDFDIERKAIYDAAFKRMEDDKVPENQRADKLPEYVATAAGASFDRMVNTTIAEETRKTNAARLLKGDTYINLKEERKAKVSKITSTNEVPPALEQERLNRIKAIDDQIEKVQKGMRQQEQVWEGEEGSKPPISGYQKEIERLNKEKENIQQEELKFDNYFLISETPKSEEAEFIFKKDKTSVSLNPSYVYSVDGQYFIGGTQKLKDGKVKDVSVPYNETNYRKLAQENPNAMKKLKGEGVPYFDENGNMQQDKKKKASSEQAAEPAAKKTKYVPPKKGDVVDGYKFLGGDDTNPDNWKKI